MSIFFRLTPEQAQAIEDRGDVPIDDATIQPTVYIPFRVVERTHALNARGGELRVLGESLVLEAETGVGEDIVRWVCCGERPGWAEE